MKQWCFWAGCHAKIVIGAVSCGHPNFQQCCCWCFLARPCQSCRDDLILKWEFCRAFPESGISLVVPDTVFFHTWTSARAEKQHPKPTLLAGCRGGTSSYQGRCATCSLPAVQPALLLQSCSQVWEAAWGQHRCAAILSWGLTQPCEKS